MSRTNKTWGRLAAIVCCGLSAQLHADGNALREVPLPPGATLAIVGENLLQNGSRVSIATFRSENSAEQVLEFYREHWPDTDDAPGYVEHNIEPWQIISRVSNNINLVLQLQRDDRGGSSGLLSALDLEKSGERLDPIALPAGTEVLSSTGSEDQGRQADTWFLRSRARVGEVAGFYADYFAGQGWTVVSEHVDGHSAVVLMSSHRGSLEVTATRDSDGTFVVVNRVRTAS